MQTINREHFKSCCPSIFETTRTQETTVNLLNDFKTLHSFLTTSMFGFGRQHSKAQCHFFFYWMYHQNHVSKQFLFLKNLRTSSQRHSSEGVNQKTVSL